MVVTILSRQSSHSVDDGAWTALQSLLASCRQQLAEQFLAHVQNIRFTSSSPRGEKVYFPCPLKEQEAVLAVKALEACAVAAIADLRYGPESRRINIDTDKTACFLMSAYLSTVDGMDKGNTSVRSKLPGSVSSCRREKPN